MKLRNKKTGEIKAFDEVMREAYKWNNYNSLAELDKEWEDYEEPKNYWFITVNGEVDSICEEYEDEEDTEASKEIGNYFETEEEAEKAVEKLKAWKRLKEAGFRLSAVVDSFFCLDIFMKGEPYEVIKDDLKIVFGGEG